MQENSVRITGITIRNFKNVESGSIDLTNKRKTYKASVLGLYGQNGSGKTALIDCLELLHYALCSISVPDEFADYIHVDSGSSELGFHFDVTMSGKSYPVYYQFSICADPDSGVSYSGLPSGGSRVRIYDELLKCPMFSNDSRSSMGKLIDTRDSDTFKPETKRNLLIGKDKSALTSLLVARKLTGQSSRSFVFSGELLQLAEKKEDAGNVSDEFRFYYDILKSLSFFGWHELFVINTKNPGLIRLNLLPLSFRYEYENKMAQGTMILLLDRPFVIPVSRKNLADKMIRSMNIVLRQIVPGLTISIMELGTEIMENGETGIKVQLMSEKNSRSIPLKYESDGIKKIISILQLLIIVYNEPSFTLAVDELDAGIFEYLLGELLRIISEKGKGQLIFTSHNLRPLETLDKGFVAFTTTNPKNRYVRMTNVKENNNLRDFYYRDIMLGEQNEELYERTDNAEIAFAFLEAGETDAA